MVGEILNVHSTCAAESTHCIDCTSDQCSGAHIASSTHTSTSSLPLMPLSTSPSMSSTALPIQENIQSAAAAVEKKNEEIKNEGEIEKTKDSISMDSIKDSVPSITSTPSITTSPSTTLSSSTSTSASTSTTNTSGNTTAQKLVGQPNDAVNDPTTGVYDEIEIEDMEWDDTLKAYTYPCPCGDKFRITKSDLLNYDDIARCPSCSLLIRVIYEIEDLEDEEED